MKTEERSKKKILSFSFKLTARREKKVEVSIKAIEIKIWLIKIHVGDGKVLSC